MKCSYSLLRSTVMSLVFLVLQIFPQATFFLFALHFTFFFFNFCHVYHLPSTLCPTPLFAPSIPSSFGFLAQVEKEGYLFSQRQFFLNLTWSSPSCHSFCFMYFSNKIYQANIHANKADDCQLAFKGHRYQSSHQYQYKIKYQNPHLGNELKEKT